MHLPSNGWAVPGLAGLGSAVSFLLAWARFHLRQGLQLPEGDLIVAALTGLVAVLLAVLGFMFREWWRHWGRKLDDLRDAFRDHENWGRGRQAELDGRLAALSERMGVLETRVDNLTRESRRES